MLTVVTHIHPDWNRDITRCVDSVKAALPSGCKHEIIECKDNLQQARYDAMSMDDIIVFVDDDDYIAEQSLELVLQGHNMCENAVVFTNEVLVRSNGVHMPVVKQRLTYPLMTAHPRVVHHLSAIKSRYVTEKSLNTALSCGFGIEWAIKCEAAFNAGAMHVDYDGYYWVQHGNQHHATTSYTKDYQDNCKRLRKEITTWCSRRGPIMSWKPMLNTQRIS